MERRPRWSVFGERWFQPSYVIGRVDVSWSPKVVTGHQRGRKRPQAFIRDVAPRAAADDDRMPALAGVARCNYRPCATAPGGEDATNGLRGEVGTVCQADDSRLDSGAERPEPATERGADSAPPVWSVDDPDPFGVDRVGAGDHDDLVHGALGEA
jgi:hypothetical protein